MRARPTADHSTSMVDAISNLYWCSININFGSHTKIKWLLSLTQEDSLCPQDILPRDYVQKHYHELWAGFDIHYSLKLEGVKMMNKLNGSSRFKQVTRTKLSRTLWDKRLSNAKVDEFFRCVIKNQGTDIFKGYPPPPYLAVRISRPFLVCFLLWTAFLHFWRCCT